MATAAHSPQPHKRAQIVVWAHNAHAGVARATERQSHYFCAHLAQQFDMVLHIDETRAVEPLKRGAHRESGEAPETYPAGM